MPPFPIIFLKRAFAWALRNSWWKIWKGPREFHLKSRQWLSLGDSLSLNIHCWYLTQVTSSKITSWILPIFFTLSSTSHFRKDGLLARCSLPEPVPTRPSVVPRCRVRPHRGLFDLRPAGPRRPQGRLHRGHLVGPRLRAHGLRLRRTLYGTMGSRCWEPNPYNMYFMVLIWLWYGYISHLLVELHLQGTIGEIGDGELLDANPTYSQSSMAMDNYGL